MNKYKEIDSVKQITERLNRKLVNIYDEALLNCLDHKLIFPQPEIVGYKKVKVSIWSTKRTEVKTLDYDLDEEGWGSGKLIGYTVRYKKVKVRRLRTAWKKVPIYKLVKQQKGRTITFKRYSGINIDSELKHLDGKKKK